MTERLLFLTGRLAERSLVNTLENIEARPFNYEVRVLGVAVAALLTVELIKKRIGDVDGFDRVIIPGRCRGVITELSETFGITFERGPEELKDIPAFFGGQRHRYDLSRHSMKIFAEIVDAPHITVDTVLARAERYRRDGADVIDVGCIPDVDFPHLADTVRALKDADFEVSVDSLADDDLLRGGQAGADYLFSLSERSLWISDEVDSTPVLIGDKPNDLGSCCRTIDTFLEKNRAFYADPILDPIHYGFTDSIMRYRSLRDRYPDIDILMGIGNLTELTHADTLGTNTLLLGIASELKISALLTTEVSGHCVSVVRELALGRRIMHAASTENIPPRHISEGLLALHERHPFAYNSDEIGEFANAVKDANFRIQVNEDGIHIYNRDGLHSARDPYDLYPLIDIAGDDSHAFYLGLELARAQIAWQLGKRYDQDNELKWGCVIDTPEDDLSTFSDERSTLKARKARRRKKPDEAH